MIRYIKGFIKNIINPAVSKLAIVDDKSKISHLSRINRSAKIVDSTIARYSYVGGKTWIVNTDLGAFCSIARDVYIGLAGHTLSFLSTSPIFTEVHNGTGHSWIRESKHAYKNDRTVIGNDVWMGHGAKVVSGVKIGDGAVIAAGAIITKDVPPYAVVAGVPARVIRYRFPEDVRERLAIVKWWEWSDEKLKSNIAKFQTADVTLDLLGKV